VFDVTEVLGLQCEVTRVQIENLRLLNYERREARSLHTSKSALHDRDIVYMPGVTGMSQSFRHKLPLAYCLYSVL
jgi:hypothetical protein